MKIESLRKFKYGANAIALTILVGAVMVLLFGLIDRHDLRWDFTANKELSLSDQTVQVLKNLDQEVQVTAFFRRGESPDDYFIRRKVGDVLKEYAYRSPKVHYEMVDPDLEVQKAIAENITTDGTIVFRSGSQRKDVYKSQLFNYDRFSEQALPEFTGEGLFTNAMVAITGESRKTVYFLTGHGEKNLEETGPNGYRQIKDYLTKENYEVKTLNLLTGGTSDSASLEDSNLLIIASPQHPFPEGEEELLISYLKKGGNLLLLLDPLLPSSCPRILAFLGVALQADLVLDPKRHFLLGMHYPVPFLSEHEITKPLKDKGMNPVLYLARGLTLKQPTLSTLRAEKLFESSPEGWGETTLNQKADAKFDKEKDFAGPVILGVTVGQLSKKKEEAESEPASPELQQGGPASQPVTENKQPRAVVVGDSDFATNGIIQVPGNMDLFLNMVSWLVGSKEAISIRPKTPEFRNISLTEGQAQFIFWFTQFAYPLLFLGIGGFVWWRRRLL
ncbi:MAG: GldG family protein [Deltaproteobacteria bacterium]|nr:GldG family protein [Deltaproteobacteria bacterium]